MPVRNVVTQVRASALYTYPLTILKDDPLVYLRLGEASGTVAVDATPYKHNGTYNASGVTYGQSGLITNDPGTAVLLDGSAGYIALPSSFVPTRASALSVECWVKFPSIGFSGNPRLIASDNPGTGGFTFHVNNGAGQTNFLVGNGSGNAIGYNTTQLVAGTKYYLVGIWDGVHVNVYVNTVIGGQNNLSGTLGSTANAVNIGRNPAYNGDYAPCVISEVALYNFALSPTQMSTHYLAGQ